MYGHQSTAVLPEGYPQFMAGGEGARVTDVDGNTYVDLMCSYGPIILGHRHPDVEAAASAQAARADCQNGPGTVMVELAERLVERVAHADWAMFAKNGTDATTTCVTIARAQTRRNRVLVATGAYHGAAPWCTPVRRGVTAEDRANLDHFTFNDLDSVIAAVERAGDDLAAIVVSPFRHDARHPQELVDVDFARGLRRICDDTGAALVLDDVRCGLRLHHGGSWEPIGVEPDLSAWSKAIANGYALAAVCGNDRFRDGASRIYVTGSFWFSAVAMAASLATLDVLRDTDAVATMEVMGRRLREGLAAQAADHGLAIRQTGPVQMPLLTFEDDDDLTVANRWAGEAVRRGAYVHPWHNWFLSAAHTADDIDRALEATDEAFAAVRRDLGGR
ncbi:MAG: aminotransferase class III-fold pyridoxal phosphate-dependent enzyme [Actinomycetota bacterium]|nr:aminotransferase class III-fold pyridoxal phosphate-dependent enzyme [Actinomycetota bacterium]